MKNRWRLGPVFEFESLIAARRWQIYAQRSIYVGLLFVGLTLTWGPTDQTIKSLAEAAAIVWGKWWGTFAMVPRLAILPIWVAAGASMVTDGGLGLVLMIGLILAYAAAITSLGLAAATWVPRLGRVITVSVMAYVLVAAGWPLVLQVLPEPCRPSDRAARFQQQTWDGLSLASPFFEYLRGDRVGRSGVVY